MAVYTPFSCPSSLEYLRPRALILLKTWHYISRLLTYLLTYLLAYLLVTLCMRERERHNNNRSFHMVKTHAQPYKHILHVYVYNEQPVSQDSNNAAHTLPCRTATIQGLARRISCQYNGAELLTIQSVKPRQSPRKHSPDGAT